jgi:integrase
MPQKLTDSLVKDVKELPSPAHGNKIYYDTEVAGFGCRVTAAGARSFVINYRTRAGKERRYTIGAVGDWNVTAARKVAREIRRKLPDGVDPLATIQAERDGARTVAAMCKRFKEDHFPELRKSTRRNYELMINREIIPTIGKLKVADVTSDDIDRLHRRIRFGDAKRRARPYWANRVAAVLSAMFMLASTRWNPKWCVSNPVKGLRRADEEKRKRYLKNGELERFMAALAGLADQQAAAAIRLLLLTGARAGEVLRMRWQDLDLESGTWTKPSHTVKQKADHVLPLSAPARQILAALYAQRGGSKFVFPGGSTGGHRTDIRAAWRELLRAAEITDLRIHDLRHSHASHLASAGFSLPTIGALLGHSNPATTARYAHLFDEVTRQATERVGAVLSGIGKPAAEPVPFKKSR